MEPQKNKTNDYGNWMVGLFIVGVVACFLASRSGKPNPRPNPIDPSLSAPSAPPVYLPRPNPAPSTFDSDDCRTANCNGHQAGYNWARDKQITDEDDCEPAALHYNSPSFGAGCREYIEDVKLDRDLDKEMNSDRDPAQDRDPPQ